ncbi:hypothetical protein JA1_000945 [Spathaspora sp. JA1]|nr:hypothetical protein JA1_000945 [Spathaspora sp. JA1]
MNQRYQERLYSDIFDRENDETFYRSLFTTPVNQAALLESFGFISSKDDSISSRKLSVLQRIFQTGLTVYADAIGYIEPSQAVELTIEHSESVQSSQPLDITESVESGLRSFNLLDVEGDDITELSGKSSKNSSQQQILDDDGDDLTSLSGQPSTTQLNEEIHTSRSVSATPVRESEFDSLSSELRADLIVNILQIFQIWFKNITNTNEKLKGSITSFGLTTRVDLNVSLFSGELTVLSLVELLTRMKWFLHSTLNQIQKGESELKLPIIRQSMILLREILKSIYFGLTLHSTTGSDYYILKNLLFTFYQVNFSNEIQSIITITQPFKNENEEKYQPPKVQLSIDSLLTLYLILGVLVNIPNSLLPSHLNSSDITAMSIQSLNPYKSMPLFLTEYNNDSFQICNSRLLPSLCMEFNYCYSFRPDLMLDKIKTNSIFNWLNLSTDAYINCDTVESVTSLTNKKLNLLEVQDDFLIHLQHAYESKIRKSSDQLDLKKLLPITLTFKALTENTTFVDILTKQNPKIGNEVLTEDEFKNVELFEVWLSLTSYIFEHQYSSPTLQYLTTLSLGIMLNLTSNHMNKLRNYQINEDKWKLCHQKLPFIPLGLGNFGYKSSLFYILDCVQNLIRFNLTNKLNIKNYGIGLNLIYQIITDFEKDTSIALGKYNWVEFHTTIFTLIKFIDKQNLLGSKKLDTEQVRVLVEELLVIVDFMLRPRFNQAQQIEESNHWFWNNVSTSINYSLIYNILLNFETLTRLINEAGLTNLTRLPSCMNHFENQFHLTAESKLQPGNKLDISDFDYDSPKFVEKINEYLSQESEEVNPSFKYKDSFSYLNGGTVIQDNEMITYIQSAFP